MKKLIIIAIAVLCLVACGERRTVSEEQIREICRHIPNTERLEECKPFLTDDFYAALDAMISRPDSTAVLHEWELWFVTADGSPMADAREEIVSIEPQDTAHMQIVVRLQAPDADYEAEEHTLLLEKVDTRWLLSDLDSYKSHAQARAAQGKKNDN